MLGDVRTEVEKYIPDYSLNIVELRGEQEYHFQNEEIENLFKISRACLNRDKQELEKIKNIEVGSELASMLGTILKSKTLLERPNKEGMVKMCTLFDEIEKTGYEKGEKSGYEKGEMYGIYGIINAMKSMDAPADKIIGQLMIQMKLSKKEAQSYIKKHYNN